MHIQFYTKGFVQNERPLRRFVLIKKKERRVYVIYFVSIRNVSLYSRILIQFGCRLRRFVSSTVIVVQSYFNLVWVSVETICSFTLIVVQSYFNSVWVSAETICFLYCDH